MPTQLLVARGDGNNEREIYGIWRRGGDNLVRGDKVTIDRDIN